MKHIKSMVDKKVELLEDMTLELQDEGLIIKVIKGSKKLNYIEIPGFDLIRLRIPYSEDSVFHPKNTIYVFIGFNPEQRDDFDVKQMVEDHMEKLIDSISGFRSSFGNDKDYMVYCFNK